MAKKRTEKVKVKTVKTRKGVNLIKNLKNDKITKLAKILPKAALIVLVVSLFFVLGSFFYQYKGLLVPAIVNKQPIISLKWYQRLINQYGKTTLDQLIVEKLIFDEAKKRKITIAQSEIDQEINKVKENLGSETKLLEALKQQNMKMSDLRERIKLQLIATKLVEEKVNITEAEVDKYIQDNKNYLPQTDDQNKQKEEIKQFLRDQKIAEEIQSLVNELKQSANITIFL